MKTLSYIIFAIFILLIGISLYTLLSWKIYKRPTFLSEKKNCMPIVCITAPCEQVESIQEKLFGKICIAY